MSSRTLPPTSLVIAPGKAAWSIYIDVVCINFDGNAYDAAVLAVMAALRNSELSLFLP
jgi:exosome complex component RRP43